MHKTTDLNGIGMTSPRTRTRLVSRLRAQGISDERVLNIINNIPRHIFIDEALAHRAYEDNALPIGFNQTISQPYIVARMTEALITNSLCTKVLEIGTGSGYQTAILAHLSRQVYSVERIQGLLSRAKRRLTHLGLRNIHYKYDDGNVGWHEHAPFDGIIVTASPNYVPDVLLAQLDIGGRLVIPVGDHRQQLKLIIRHEEGFQTDTLNEVRFVPLLGGRA